MPLIQSKSKKAMSKNIETEMDAGKPQKQAVAIAYAVKRKAPKKMAEGGVISAKTEKRPMPNERDNDKVTVEHNSSIKPSKNDSWTDRSTVAQAQKPSPTSLKEPMPLKMSKMVESSSPFKVRDRRMMDEERNMQAHMKPASPAQQPEKRLDEEGANRQGPSTPDLKMKKMYEGGVVSQKAAEEDEEPGISPIRESYEHPSEEEYMSTDRMAPMLAEGGMAGMSDIDHEMMMQPQDEQEEMMHASLADAIMAKRRREATSMSGDPDYPVKMAEGGQVDLNLNSMEQPNAYYRANEEALKENYDEDMEDVSQPEDSNETGDEREKSRGDKHDMIDSIRSKMASDRRKQRR